MIITTVIAVALGLAPVKQDGTVERSRDEYKTLVGPYSQSTDAQGRTFVRGFNRLTGAAYDLALDKHGNVSAEVGDWEVTFQVREIN